MTCPHCNSTTTPVATSMRAIEGGIAFGYPCETCGHIMIVRPRTENDPPILPADLSQQELDRLRFVQWRLADELRTRRPGAA